MYLILGDGRVYVLMENFLSAFLAEKLRYACLIKRHAVSQAQLKILSWLFVRVPGDSNMFGYIE